MQGRKNYTAIPGDEHIKNYFRNRNMFDKHYVCDTYLFRGVLSLKKGDLCDYNF
jgi:hypothetical protein